MTITAETIAELRRLVRVYPTGVPRGSPRVHAKTLSDLLDAVEELDALRRRNQRQAVIIAKLEKRLEDALQNNAEPQGGVDG